MRVTREITHQASVQPFTEKAHYYKSINPSLLDKALKSLKVFERFLAIPVFREFRKSDNTGTPDGTEVFNGNNVISKLRLMQQPLLGKEEERNRFDKIQRFVQNLLGVSQSRIEIPVEEDQIYIVMHNNRLPLESYGTGIHHLVILCAALAIYDDYFVGLEEPEVHLHPELQRKFLRFISDDTRNTYFITTHSNVFLDSAVETSIYHVSFDGEKSTLRR